MRKETTSFRLLLQCAKLLNYLFNPLKGNETGQGMEICDSLLKELFCFLESGKNGKIDPLLFTAL